MENCAMKIKHFFKYQELSKKMEEPSTRQTSFIHRARITLCHHHGHLPAILHLANHLQQGYQLPCQAPISSKTFLPSTSPHKKDKISHHQSSDTLTSNENSDDAFCARCIRQQTRRRFSYKEVASVYSCKQLFTTLTYSHEHTTLLIMTCIMR